MRAKLACEGGPKACQAPWPERGLFGLEEKAAVNRLFDAAIATGRAFGYNGEEEAAYCRDFAKHLGGGFADAVNSGTSAVYVAVRALEIPAFSEVICSCVTDPGGVMPVALCNCIPVPADTAPGSFNVGPAQIEARLTPRTKAILVTHIAGIPVDLGPILELAKARGLPVIEDCAQAHGARYKGRGVGAWGSISAFSTMFGKHHATGGQGGVVFTRDEELGWRVRRYADRGKPFNLPAGSTNVAASLNLNQNELNACIGRVQLLKLPQIVQARQRSARKLIDACRRELKAVRIVDGPAGTDPSYWFLFAQLDLDKLTVDKATFVNALYAEGVPCTPGYLHLFSDATWYREQAVFAGSRYPWGSPDYKGNPGKVYTLPNIRRTDTYTFTIPWHERVTSSNIRGLLRSLKKVEHAFLA